MNAALSTVPAGKGFDREMLNGWKEISSELNPSVRTVQRWERELQLPIHRLRDGHAVPVFAFKEELQLWLAKGLERKPVQ